MDLCTLAKPQETRFPRDFLKAEILFKDVWNITLIGPHHTNLFSLVHKLNFLFIYFNWVEGDTSLDAWWWDH